MPAARRSEAPPGPGAQAAQTSASSRSSARRSAAAPGLVDVVVAGHPRHSAVGPLVDRGVALVNLAGAASGAATEIVHGKDHAAADVQNLLDFNLELLVDSDPVGQKAAYRVGSLEDAHPQQGHVPDRIWTVDAQGGIEITIPGGFDRVARKLNQVGGCGLLGHHRVIIPAERHDGTTESPRVGGDSR